MKKIMIAMGAVMSLALGAFAVDVPNGTLKNAMMFNGITSGTSITNGLEDSGYSGAVEGTAYIGDGGVHWECAGSTEDSVITNQTGYTYGEYLQIDQTDTLYRWMEQTTSSTTNEVSSTKGIYFASKVQFTASDETNGVTLVTGGDKLLIWLRAADTNEDDVVDGTNLIITASADYPGEPPTDFVIDNSVYNVVPGEWYQLLVKSEYFNNGAGSVGIAFTVKIGAPGALESAMTTLKANGTSTFYSMDANSTADDLSIAKVGFKGTGAADDLEFGTFEIAADTPFSVGGTPFATFDAAVAAAGDGGTVVLTKNYEATTSLNVGNGTTASSIILDLAGHELSSANVVIYVNASATLIITNSTPTVGSVKCTGANTAAISNLGFLNIYGGKFFGDGTDYGYGYMTVLVDDAAIDNNGEVGKTTAYYVNTATGTSTESVLQQVASGDDAGYWVIKEVAFVQDWVVTFSTNETVVAEYTTNVVNEQSLKADQIPAFTGGAWDVDPTNAVITCATNFNYTISPTWEVTFSTNGTHVEEYDTTVEDGKSLAAAQIPAFTGGEWVVDPTNAVITCATNFNYTISGSNWPEAWSNDSAYAADYTSKLTAWMATNSISSMGTLTEADETAFLLNIAPDEAVDKTIDATAITIDGTTVKITVDQKLGSANGVVYLMYGPTPALGSVTDKITFVNGEGNTPSSMTTLEGETATAQFYKVGVGFAAPVTAEP